MNPLTRLFSLINTKFLGNENDIVIEAPTEWQGLVIVVNTD